MKKLLLLIITMTFFAACKLSTEELSKEVVKNMQETFNQQNSGIVVNNLILTHKSDNEYSGVLQTTEPNGKFTYNVQVIYDGENMTWKVLE